MVIKRIGALSCAKVLGLLYAFLGFLIGAVVALISLAGGFAAAQNSVASGRSFALFFGVGAVILFPIIYGIIGFFLALIGAAIYNVLAGIVGGIQVEVAPNLSPGWNAVARVDAPPAL